MSFRSTYPWDQVSGSTHAMFDATDQPSSGFAQPHGTQSGSSKELFTVQLLHGRMMEGNSFEDVVQGQEIRALGFTGQQCQSMYQEWLAAPQQFEERHTRRQIDYYGAYSNSDQHAGFIQSVLSSGPVNPTSTYHANAGSQYWKNWSEGGFSEAISPSINVSLQQNLNFEPPQFDPAVPFSGPFATSMIGQSTGYQQYPQENFNDFVLPGLQRQTQRAEAVQQGVYQGIKAPTQGRTGGYVPTKRAPAWTVQEEDMLAGAVKEQQDAHAETVWASTQLKLDWREVLRVFADTLQPWTAEQCRSKWYRTKHRGRTGQGGSVKHTPWTSGDDQFILEAAGEGRTMKRISDEMGRTQNAVRFRYEWLKHQENERKHPNGFGGV